MSHAVILMSPRHVIAVMGLRRRKEKTRPGGIRLSFVSGLNCVFCGAAYSTRVPYTCPACGITGILDVQYDYRAVGRKLTRQQLARRTQDHWRYAELLPITDVGKAPPLSVGWTPIYRAKALGQHLGIRTLYLKDEGRNPTASLKDRASSVAVARAREKHRKIIACASTGNAASSLAGIAASVGLRSVIFVPQRFTMPKINYARRPSGVFASGTA